MPSLASRHEFHVAVSLLYYTYHGERLRHAGEGFLDDRTAFVHRNGGFYTVAHEPVAAVRRAAAGRFLIVGIAEVDVLFGSEALRDKFVHALDRAEQRILAVHGAAPPHLAVGNGRGERRILPVAFRRHDVLMRHEHERTGRRLPFPPEHQRVAALSSGHDDFARGIHVRKLFRKHLAECGETLAVHARNGGHADQFCETLGISLRFVCHTAPHIYARNGVRAKVYS